MRLQVLHARGGHRDRSSHDARAIWIHVEMLYLAHMLGYRVCEVPVVWRHAAQTRVHAVRDSASMIADLLSIRWNYLCGQYDARKCVSARSPV